MPTFLALGILVFCTLRGQEYMCLLNLQGASWGEKFNINRLNEYKQQSETLHTSIELAHQQFLVYQI